MGKIKLLSLAENVKNLTGEKFKNEFKTVPTSLEEVGYNNYWEILNAKNIMCRKTEKGYLSSAYGKSIR